MKNIEYTNEISNYDEKTVKRFLELFKRNLIENKEYIESANNIDNKFTKKKIKLDVIIEIVDKYKDATFNNLDKNFVIYYKGDPYITINLFMQAMFNRSKVILAYDKFMIAINEILFKIFNKTLEEIKVKNLVERISYNKKQIKEIQELIDAEIISIGDTLMYQMLDENGKFFPFYNIIMYCDNDVLDPVRDAISIYSNENHYELETIYESNLDIVINYINMIETSNIVVVLSNNKSTIEKFQNSINKKLFINENPFLKSYGKIYDYLK